ncbi:hypothetical protein OMW55_09650 [Sphingomonas sp. BN140010]|uniref:Uncharacterized protein n=1 Tax=Sphingomonas arvum TaxID=2992113 RepID=A0ABT3JG48_9SPHN|nr:hypothetical protein [Sphingomonas sp. BN140010]MCW3798066.1 hypothetical protein [Sphingomonas sp. BN140010]
MNSARQVAALELPQHVLIKNALRYGEITLYDASLCTPKRLTAGQTFVDEGGDHVHLYGMKQVHLLNWERYSWCSQVCL